MRRLVVEISTDQFVSMGGGDQGPGMTTLGPGAELLDKLKSLEMVHILRMVPGEFAAVLRIEVKNPSIKPEEILHVQGVPDAEVETELLERESDTVFICFLRAKSRVRPEARQLVRAGSLPYFATPFELKDGKLRATFLGTSAQIRGLLANLSRQTRVKYRVASLTDAKFPPNSPMGRLTDKQRRILISAYKLGYYDVPRRITAEELAKRLGLVKSTLSAHVRKAERRLLTEMLSEF